MKIAKNIFAVIGLIWVLLIGATLIMAFTSDYYDPPQDAVEI